MTNDIPAEAWTAWNEYKGDFERAHQCEDVRACDLISLYGSRIEREVAKQRAADKRAKEAREKAEWDRATTSARRAEWNAGIRALVAVGGKKLNVRDVQALEGRLGFSFDSLKLHACRHNLPKEVL